MIIENTETIVQQTDKSACVVTFGCQQNEADSEKIKGMLAAMGYTITDEENIDKCQVVIYNTCAIREHAELKALSRTGQLKRHKDANRDMLIGICGCMAEQEHRVEYIKKSFPYVDFLFGTHSLHKFPEILSKAILTRRRIFIKDTDEIIAEDLPVYRESNYKAKVSVMYGCNNFCSYCVVPYVRGRERSRDKDNILSEVGGLIADGYKDITLLGQNVNSYKCCDGDAEYDFTNLLSDILAIDGDYLIRFITSHPKDVPDGLIKLMGENNKLAKHFHLPVQSGSNRILKLMNRKYTREYYLDLVGKLRSAVKDIAITTDIIVGFPTETDEDFRDTIEIIKAVEFDNIFPFIYSKRKGTPAADMKDDISKEEKTNRFLELMKIQTDMSMKKNREYEGKIVRVLVESVYKSAKDKSSAMQMAGRTSSHKLVVFDGSETQIGEFADVKITEAKLHALYGQCI